MAKVKRTRKRKYIRDGRAPIPKKEVTSRVMSSIKAKNTQPEILLRKALVKNGLVGYRLHWEKAVGRPDICYPGRKIAIFVHGCFWHRCPRCHPKIPTSHKGFWKEKFRKNVQRDKKKKRLLENDSWEVLTFWECQVRKRITFCVKKTKRVYRKNET